MREPSGNADLIYQDSKGKLLAAPPTLLTFAFL